jgi:hypothetical protein
MPAKPSAPSGASAPTRYAFFVYPSTPRDVGLAFHDGVVAVHVPSSSGSSERARIPGRPDLIKRLVGDLQRQFGAATVVACRSGRLDSPFSPVGAALSTTGADALLAAFRDGGNFRFDFWLRFSEALPVATLVSSLGLVPAADHPVDVIWPPADPTPRRQPNAWVLRRAAGAGSPYQVTINIGAALTNGILLGDGVVVCSTHTVERFAKVYRKRATDRSTTLYFDGSLEPEALLAPSALGLGEVVEAPLRRIEWPVFASALHTATGTTFQALPVLTGETNAEKAYLRELLQDATMDDLLGPANGPTEDIVGMGVRDRYLVGKLAPREIAVGSLDIPSRTELSDADETPAGEVPANLQPLAEVGEGKQKSARRRLPGEEFSAAPNAGDIEEDADAEDSTSTNQSFIPSSMGLTICVDKSVEALEIEVRWGRYARLHEHEYTKEVRRKVPGTDQTTIDRVKERVWRRTPSGGVVRLGLVEGRVKPQNPDAASPSVLLQGTVRAPLPSGDRLVTVFLVNDQLAAKTNQDEAWVFQPEIIVRHPRGEPVFRRRPVALGAGSDFDEEAALEMIYRKRVEFGVGHGVSIHATLPEGDTEHASEVRTAVMPQYEVAVTETPGSDPEDRPAMRRMLAEGFLDMTELAGLPRPKLVGALTVLADDYQAWIAEQRGRIGSNVVGHDSAANAAVSRCDAVLERLRAGIRVLDADDVALEAFRFANRAMANQRIRSVYSLLRRRGQEPDLAKLDERKNRSWRPFQLAFVVLSIPALADPQHADRTNPVDGVADLIWFPTGGGKTEAYLGVAAFTMAIRRMRSSLGGLDGSRGLSVIMRYTLRLLTLQQYQRASTLLCAMEVLRRDDPDMLGTTPFSIGLWVGKKVTPNSTEASHEAIEAERTGRRASSSTPAQLTSCPWCGTEIQPGRDVEVRRFKSGDGRTVLYCGDKLGRCEFSRGQSKGEGLPVVVVDEELYRRPPTMLIATVDKFASMAWKGAVRALFGRADAECPRHGLLWPGSECNGSHNRYAGMPAVSVKRIKALRPPDLIIQDEFHLISGPLGTMVGLYETAVDELCCWRLGDAVVRPKVIASTATVRKAAEQVNNVFLRRVAIFPPHGLDIEDNFFAVQRSITARPGRRYLGICAPGSARPAVLIRLYTALLTAGQELFDHFGAAVDPWMTVVGYFNSLRELGGMKRLAEDDVQTRCYRVQMSAVQRPGLAQRDLRIVDELTSRVSGKDIPKKLDQLEVPFKAQFDVGAGRWKTPWEKGETRPMDVVLATNMLSVGVDVNRIGLMAVNGQPKNTAEYIQATSRVGRAFPGLVCTVLTWSRPRDLSHYETFEHYHATFYRHVEAQSVTPFAPRALDRGLTGMMVSWLRLSHDEYNPNLGAGAMTSTGLPEVGDAKAVASERGYGVTDRQAIQALAEDMVAQRCDEWVKQANKPGRRLGYERGRTGAEGQGDIAGLLRRPGIQPWDRFTVPTSLREVEPGAPLVMLDDHLEEGPDFRIPPLPPSSGGAS